MTSIYAETEVSLLALLVDIAAVSLGMWASFVLLSLLLHKLRTRRAGVEQVETHRSSCVLAEMTKSGQLQLVGVCVAGGFLGLTVDAYLPSEFFRGVFPLDELETGIRGSVGLGVLWMAMRGVDKLSPKPFVRLFGRLWKPAGLVSMPALFTLDAKAVDVLLGFGRNEQ